jgi:hypothetical protein
MRNTPDAGPRSAFAEQRRDDSTLFSLRNLMKQGAAPKEEAAPNRDDSGLIDLAALAAAHEEPAERPKLDVAPRAGVGLFEVPEKAPEPVSPAPVQAPARAPTRRTAALLAGAVVLVAAASAIAIITTRGSGDTQLPAVAALHTAAAPVSPLPKPSTTEAPAPVEVKPPEAVAKPSPSAAQSPSRRVPKPPASAVVKPVPPKPEPPCDLMCQMQKRVAGSR